MDSQNKSTDITILNLPNEIIEQEILPRLAVKPLLRFRCVSKSWRLLIGSQGFIKSHLKNSIKNPSFPHQRAILHNNDAAPKQCSLQSLLNESSSMDPSPLDDPTRTPSTPFQIMGCYNGLVCILEQPLCFTLWNPSTGICKILPEIDNYTTHLCNPGFGWFESSGEYMVFAVVLDSGKRVGKVYSSKTNSWKTIGKWNFPLNCDYEEGVFVGGKLHWKCNDDIVFVDLKSEVFGRIELPFVSRYFFRPFLGDIGGCVCVLYYDERDIFLRDQVDLYYDQIGVQVWVMKECSWERVVTQNHLLELLRQPFSAPLVVGKNGEILVFRGSGFLVYHPQDDVFRHSSTFCSYHSHHLYIGSLVSPHVV